VPAALAVATNPNKKVYDRINLCVTVTLQITGQALFLLAKQCDGGGWRDEFETYLIARTNSPCSELSALVRLVLLLSVALRQSLHRCLLYNRWDGSLLAATARTTRIRRLPFFAQKRTGQNRTK
jgi:hypothetical protein